MSSQYDDPQLTEGLLEQCLDLLADERLRGRQDQQLRGVDDETFVRQGGSFPRRLAELLEERSRGTFTILEVDTAVVPQPLARSVYFVRTRVDAVDEQVVEPVAELRDGMVLCEINPYISKLMVGVQFNTPEEIQARIARREEQRVNDALRQAEEGRRRARVGEEYSWLLSRIELFVERANDARVQEKWRSMRSTLSLRRGRIELEDLLDLCDRLGIDLAILATRPPS